MEDIKSLKKNKEGKAGQIIRIEEEQLSRHLDKVVRGTVEETLNALLDAEADQLCQAGRYERTEKRQDTRAGHYKRNLDTKAGQVQLQVPKLRTLSFETAIIERYRRRESSVEEALIEMYLAGVSVGNGVKSLILTFEKLDSRSVSGMTNEEAREEESGQACV